MAEYIEREALVHLFMNSKRYLTKDLVMDAAYEIEKFPAADVVAVVRCEDCKHWLKDVAGCTDAVGRCEWANYMIGAKGYCVYGERRGDDGN